MPSEAASIEELFGEALSKGDAPARAQFLNQACATDTSLRQRLDALLTAHDAAANFLKLPDSDHARITEHPGTRIGRYKLLEQIGEGGFGVVFMAEQEEPVRRKVALKIIKLGMDTKQVIARFEAERQALAMMDHPNIAKVLDAGSTDTGRPFFVMELVKGIPLTTYCDSHNLSIIQRLELFIPICHAIQHAHQKGIIHRDLKPSNVLVTRHDDRPIPMVIDFGVAKATQEKLTEKTLFTGFRQLIGTPSYMSPEQAQMDAADIDTRTDIYSLGALLYELLSGTPPFDPRELHSKTFAEMQRMIREVEPAQPSIRLTTLVADARTLRAQERQSDPKRLAQMVRGELDWIVMRCLEKDRNRRYETASALAEDLQRYLHDEPIQARRPTRLYRIKKFIRRNKIPVLAGGAIIAALAAGVIVASAGLLHARRQADIARVEALRSKEVAQFLKSMLDGVSPSVALGRDTTILREILDTAAQRVANDLKDQPEVEAELRSFIGRAYFEITDYPAAEAMHRQALALRRGNLGNAHPDVAVSLHALGVVLCIRDQPHPRYKEAESLFREALTIRRKVFSEIHPDVAATLFDLGLCLWREQDPALYPEAEMLQRQAVAIHEKLGNQNTYAMTSALQGLGLALMSQGKYAEAEPLFRTTLDQRRKLLAHDDPHLTYPMGNVATILYLEKRNLPEAEALARESLTIRRKSERKDHKDVAEEVELLADILAAQSKWAEAEPLYRERIEWQQKFRNENTAELANLIDRLANVLHHLGMIDESDQLHREALKLTATPPPTSKP